MLQKRREVDAGNATVADLQIYYLQKDASSWVKTSTDYLNLADQETKNLVEKRRKSDDDAGTEIIVIASVSTLIALGARNFYCLQDGALHHRTSRRADESRQADRRIRRT